MKRRVMALFRDFKHHTDKTNDAREVARYVPSAVWCLTVLNDSKYNIDPLSSTRG